MDFRVAWLQGLSERIGLLDRGAEGLFLLLLRNSLAIAATAGAVWLLVKFLAIRSPRWRRLLAVGILLQGCILYRWEIELPWRTVAAQRRQSASLPGDRQAPANLAPVRTTTADEQVVPPDWSAARVVPALPEGEPAVAASWSRALLAIWIAGVMVAAALATMLYLRLWLAVRGEPTIAPAELPEWRETLAAMGMHARRRLTLRFTTGQGPSVMLLPGETTVLVPRDVWSELSDSQRVAILRHELAHVARGDLWKSLAVRVLALPYWFNPGAWWGVALFDEAAEWACDEMATRAGLPPHDYSRLLVQVSSGWPHYPARPFGAGATRLAKRIGHLLEPVRRSDPITTRGVLAVLLAVLLMGNALSFRVVAAKAVVPPAEAAQAAPTPPAEAGTSQPATASTKSAEPANIILDCQAVDAETGQPVAGAAIVVTWVNYSIDQDPAERTRLFEKRQLTKTGADGRYQVLIPTWVQARRDLNAYVEAKHANYLHYWGSESIAAIVDPPLAAKPPEFTVTKMTPGREIVGRVVDPAGNPLADVQLYKEYSRQPQIHYSTEPQIRDNEFPVTDSQGRFRCLVAAKGYVAIRFRATPDFFEVPYEISAQRDQGDIRLSRGTRFRGRVLTSSGEPLKNAKVTVTLLNSNTGSNTDCDAQGNFLTEAFGPGTHTISAGWIGPPGVPRNGFTWNPPELYLPQEVLLTAEQDVREVEFRPVESVQIKGKVMTYPKPTGDGKADLFYRMPIVNVQGLYQGRPWSGGGADFHDDGTGRSFLPRAPKGLTRVELSFGNWPQRVQLNGDAPLLFGSALKLEKLENDLTDIRMFRYEPTAVEFVIRHPADPKLVEVSAVYAREAEMREAGMEFATADAAMRRGQEGNKVKFLILPDESVQFTVKSPGYRPLAQELRLVEGETKRI
ncbi:MAG: hypothetical protein JNG90_00795, partial [Planctomycetaceae bacterium]|nr:hypothetical protein [Planctomycetaceae bacterium]